MISKVRGRFANFSGTIDVAEDPLQSTLTATVDLASVDTGDATRDEHLRGADFFAVDEFPQMTFVSTHIKVDDDDYLLFGDLTIKGVTREVAFELEFEGVTTDPWGNTKAGFSAKAEVNRKDWGLNWNLLLEAGGVTVGDKIKIELDI